MTDTGFHCLILARFTGTPDQRDRLRGSQHDFLRQLQQEGKLVLAGFFKETREGVIVLRVQSEEEAKRLFAGSPYAVQGLVEYEVKAWQRVM